MKPTKFLTISTCLILLAFAIKAFANHKVTPAKNNSQIANGKGFALVELFTSEGCSSCPPADALLARIQKETKDKPVYILAYHVDYWNHQGWKDVFSSAEYTNRQRAYSHFLNVSIYTPQVVVNGRSEYVGSDEPALRSAITGALAIAPVASVTLLAQQNGDKLTVNYEVSGTTNTGQLLIAIVQKNAVSKIQGGENEGRTLAHAQIVRGLQMLNITPEKKGAGIIKLPKGFDSESWEVVGFIQDKASGEILTATKAIFNKPPRA